jgi:hypothetical protein
MDWGYGSMIYCNLLGWRAPRPEDMKAASEPVGRGNNEAILDLANRAGIVIAAWGNHGSHLHRSAQICGLLAEDGVLIYCLGTTSTGEPRHPLYVKRATWPVIYKPPA